MVSDPVDPMQIQIFPEPQVCHLEPGAAPLHLPLAPAPVVGISPRATDREQEAAETLAQFIQQRTGVRLEVVPVDPATDPVSFFVGTRDYADTGSSPSHDWSERIPERSQGYTLWTEDETVFMIGNDEAGALYAVMTAVQLLQGLEVSEEALRFPRVSIRDWPAYGDRGLYVESFWGTDLMTLEDWQRLIDSMASLKLNLLGIGLYGCWEIKHDAWPSEFLLVPLEGHPELQTPQTVRYFSPETEQWEEITYLPPIFEQDFLGEIIRYAAARSVRVLPHWGGPAHNTLIPRVYPELSALDAEGNPTYYGFCLSNEKTWEFLFDVCDQIITRYLQPHGLDALHVAVDEVYPLRSVLPEAPDRACNPWCQCPGCRELSHAEFLIQYILTLAQHLKRRGCRTFVWADSLDRENGVDEFVAAVQAAGLEEDVVLQWWCYKEPLPALSSASELTTWVMPSPGILPLLLYQDMSPNIYNYLQHGWEQGATGMHAYNVPDPAYHKNYHCLAEFGWNQETTGGIANFDVKYAQRFYGSQWRPTLKAYDTAERVLGCYPLMVNMLDHLLYYFNAYPWSAVDYPADILATLADNPLALTDGIRLAGEWVKAARRDFLALELADPGGQLRDDMLLECDRVLALIQGTVGILDVLRNYLDAQHLYPTDPAAARAVLQRCVRETRAILDSNLEVMRTVKARKPAYLVPATWREQSYLVAFIHELWRELEAFQQDVALPSLSILQTVDPAQLRLGWHPWEF